MRKVHVSLCLLVAVLISGCSAGTTSSLQNIVAIPAVQTPSGSVHGGQQPVSGATIQLWAVGTTGYGSPATVLTTTTTVSDGSFSITGTYTCPASNPDVYITAAGGNPGLVAGTNNSAILLAATLTDCNTLKANAATTFININEVTTVAAAYALAQFINPANGSIGAWSSSNTGLVNAFATATNLASVATGSALATTPNGNGVVPQPELNELADILAPCVNSSSSSSSACISLFGDLKASGGIAPFNTLLAALSVALHPGYNVAALFSLAGGAPPFQPTLSVAPNDWTVAMSFNSGAAAAARMIAIDGFGNAWSITGSGRLSKLSPQGVPLNGSPFAGPSLAGPGALAIDYGNNVWVGNSGNGTLAGFSNIGGNFFLSPTATLNSPSHMVFDRNGFLWIANLGNNSVSEFNTTNTSFLSPSGGFTTGISSPAAIATDYSGNAWIANASSLAELSPIGDVSSGTPYTSGGITTPFDLAIDGSGNIWASNFPTGNVVAELSGSGSALSGSGYTGGGVGAASSIAIDGGGNVWIPVRATNSLSELSSTGVAVTPSAGYQGGGLNAPRWLAIDASGNIWVANLNGTTTGSNTTFISEFIGVAVPVITPSSLAVAELQVAKAPGTPIPVEVQSATVPYFTPSNSYSAQLYAAGGNSGNYTWSLSSGSLPSPLALSSGGLISGTSALTGTYTFTVQACDSNNLTNCGTKAMSLSANTTIPARGNESVLTGSYALQFEGYKNGGGVAQVVGTDFIASVTFNGTGGLTGKIDANSKNLSSTLSGTVSGYYSYGSDNQGTMYIIPSSGPRPIELAFVGSSLSGSTPQTLHFIEHDDTVPSAGGNNLATGAGIGKLQTSAAFAASTLNQSFVFGFQGETPCNNFSGVNPGCPSVSPFGPLSVAGKFTGNGSGAITFGEEDAAAINTSYNGITLSGSYTNPDSSGRGTLTLTPTGTLYPAPPSHYIYYIVNSGEMYVMSSDGHTTTSMLTGDALAQSGSFSASTLTGNYIAYEQAADHGDGSSTFPTALNSTLVLVGVQSGGVLNVTIDENNGQGTVKTKQTQSINYSIDSNGRMTLGTSQPVFYLANGSQGFGTEQPSATNTGSPALLAIQQQVSGSYGCAATSGVFAVSTLPSPVPTSTNVGIGDFSGGTVSLALSDTGGTLGLNTSATIVCSTDSLTATTGRFTQTFTQTYLGVPISSTNVIYTIVPNSKYVLMSLYPGDDQPNIILLEK